LVALEQQDDGQQRRIDIAQLAPHDPARQTGARRRPREQRRRQTTALQRQTGRQCRARARPAVQARQFDQAVKQRVVMQQILTQICREIARSDRRRSLGRWIRAVFRQCNLSIET